MSLQVARVALGADHLDTLLLEGKAARLDHAAKPNEVTGVQRLGDVVTRLERSLGAHNSQTVKYAAVLDQLGKLFPTYTREMSHSDV